MSIKNAMKKSYFDAIFLNVLLTNGWKMEDGFAIASKWYETAVGQKQAFIYSYFGSYGEIDYLIRAEYISQGRNILSTNSVLIQSNLDAEEIKKLAIAFIKTIEDDIDDSYAVRLHRSESNNHFTDSKSCAEAL